MSLHHRAIHAAPKVGIKRPRPMTMMATLPSQQLLHHHEGRIWLHKYFCSWATRQNVRSMNGGSCSSGQYYWNRAIGVQRNLPKNDLCTTLYEVNLQQRLRHYSSSDSSNNSKMDSKNDKNQGAALPSVAEETAANNSPLQPSATSLPVRNPQQAIKQNRAKRKRRRKLPATSIHSPLAQIMTNNHPKNTAILPSLSSNSNTARIITRKDILRLTPKQRSNLRQYQLQEYKSNRSYLDQARTNVRSNLRYLKDTADDNLRKNITTLKRLFRGDEEVWKDAIEEQSTKRIATTASKKKSSAQGEEESLMEGIDWERAPSEIKANLQSNVSKLQNWLHTSTDGMIPSSSYTSQNTATSTSTSTTGELGTKEGGSIATRLQNFHHMKQHNEGPQRLVMDWKWKAKNIALALLPGTLFHLYFLSVQDEMKEHYARVEQMEREKILGPGYTKRNDDDDQDDQDDASHGSGSGTMGISSAFITEGGSGWDRLKMTVNDVFLGGAEEKIREQKELSARLSGHYSKEEDEKGDDRNGGDASSNESHPFTSMTHTSTETSSSGTVGDAKVFRSDGGNYTHAINNESENDKSREDDDAATIQMLLQRIQALENQLGTTAVDINNGTTKPSANKNDNGLSPEEEQHLLEYKTKRVRQSPMQNRRDDQLAAVWRKEEKNKKDKEDAQKTLMNEEEKPSYSFTDVANFAMLTLEPVVDSTKESIIQAMEDLKRMVFLSSSSSEEKEKEEGNSISDDIANEDEGRGLKEEENKCPSSSPQVTDMSTRITVVNGGTAIALDTGDESRNQMSQKKISAGEEVTTTDDAEDSNITQEASYTTVNTTHSADRHGGNKHILGGLKEKVVNLWRRIRKQKGHSEDDGKKDSHCDGDVGEKTTRDEKEK
mmetsp:Transcript_17494/g.36897  ORF Transcript_17494/g.36897 Transcript_17494/m.36897 type:complete len:888 (-) Transcript_17494:62-2725(-)